MEWMGWNAKTNKLATHRYKQSVSKNPITALRYHNNTVLASNDTGLYLIDYNI